MTNCKGLRKPFSRLTSDGLDVFSNDAFRNHLLRKSIEQIELLLSEVLEKGDTDTCMYVSPHEPVPTSKDNARLKLTDEPRKELSNALY